MSFYERLSALDSSFLALETHGVHQHIGSVMIYDATPLMTPNGGIDFTKLRRHIEASLHAVPSYRQRVIEIPGEKHPVWVDDQNFDFDYHVRHIALPVPGDDTLLKTTASRIFSQQLDRSRPLWETWIIEGLAERRFAILSKVHHCMVDGAAGADIFALLHRIDRDPTVGEARPWRPRPAPNKFELAQRELARRFVQQPQAFWRGVQALREDLPSALEKGKRILQGVREGLESGAFRPASPAPWNEPLSPERSLESIAMDLNQVKAVKNTLGGTVNDVAIAVAAGALRRYLLRHEYDVDTMQFRSTLPVNVRTAADQGKFGNKVAGLVIPLPIVEPRAIDRYRAVVQATSEAKNSNQVYAVSFVERLADETHAEIYCAPVRYSFSCCASNLIITNVRGPSFPLYLLGSKLLEGFTILALGERQGLGIAVFSYEDQLLWGITADRRQVPDLVDFREDIAVEWEVIQKLAEMKGGA